MVPKSRKRKMRRRGGREEELRCAAASPRTSLRRRRGRRRGEVEDSLSKRQPPGFEREAEVGGGLDGEPAAVDKGAALCRSQAGRR